MKTTTVLSLLPPPTVTTMLTVTATAPFFPFRTPPLNKNVDDGDCSNDDVLNCGCILTFIFLKERYVC